jgi:hypothetical protein
VGLGGSTARIGGCPYEVIMKFIGKKKGSSETERKSMDGASS